MLHKIHNLTNSDGKLSSLSLYIVPTLFTSLLPTTNITMTELTTSKGIMNINANNHNNNGMIAKNKRTFWISQCAFNYRISLTFGTNINLNFLDCIYTFWITGLIFLDCHSNLGGDISCYLMNNMVIQWSLG